MRSLNRSLAVVVALGIGVLAAGWGTSTGTSADDVTIGFDDLPSDTVVSSQYHSLGVDFGSPGLLPVVKNVGSGQARSGNRVASISGSSAAVYTPDVTGTFTSPVQSVSVYVGQFAASPTTVVEGAKLTLKVYDAGHDLIDRDSAEVTPGAGFHERLSVESASANIASFEITGRDGTDDNKQLGIDDLSFSAPPPPPPTTTSTPTTTPPPPTQPDGEFTATRTQRPRLAPPKHPRLQLQMLPFSMRGRVICRQRTGSPSSRADASRLVLRFYLSAEARVSIALARAPSGRAIASFTRQARAGLNRVCLPAAFEPLLKSHRASLTVQAENGRLGKSFPGIVDLPCQACDNGPPPPDQFGVRTVLLPRSQYPIVAVAGYFAHYYQHVIVATEHTVTELFYSPTYGKDLAGVGRSLLYFSLSPIVGVAGFYDRNDLEQHVFVGAQSGIVMEIHWRPVGQYTLKYDWRAYLSRGMTAMTAFPAPVRGWNEFSQYIFATDGGSQSKLFLQQNLANPNDEFRIDVRPNENSFGTDPSLAGYYSRWADALGLLSASADYPSGASKFFPLYVGNKLNFGAWRGANDTGGGLEAAGEGKVAAWAPDDDVLVASPKFPGELHEFVPNPPNGVDPLDCQVRFDTGFYPIIDNFTGNYSHPKMHWCKNVRARLGSRIIALAGFLGATSTTRSSPPPTVSFAILPSTASPSFCKPSAPEGGVS